jgi:hypothetical protein
LRVGRADPTTSIGNATPTKEAILEAKDQYPMHGPRKLKHLVDIPLSPVSIWKVLREHDRVDESPKRQGRRSYTRYECSSPNELWKVDIMTHRLEAGEGPRRWIVIPPRRPQPVRGGLLGP